MSNLEYNKKADELLRALADCEKTFKEVKGLTKLASIKKKYKEGLTKFNRIVTVFLKIKQQFKRNIRKIEPVRIRSLPFGVRQYVNINQDEYIVRREPTIRNMQKVLLGLRNARRAKNEAKMIVAENIPKMNAVVPAAVKNMGTGPNAVAPVKVNTMKNMGTNAMVPAVKNMGTGPNAVAPVKVNTMKNMGTGPNAVAPVKVNTMKNMGTGPNVVKNMGTNAAPPVKVNRERINRLEKAAAVNRKINIHTIVQLAREPNKSAENRERLKKLENAFINFQKREVREAPANVRPIIIQIQKTQKQLIRAAKTNQNNSRLREIENKLNRSVLDELKKIHQKMATTSNNSNLKIKFKKLKSNLQQSQYLAQRNMVNRLGPSRELTNALQSQRNVQQKLVEALEKKGTSNAKIQTLEEELRRARVKPPGKLPTTVDRILSTLRTKHKKLLVSTGANKKHLEEQVALLQSQLSNVQKQETNRVTGLLKTEVNAKIALQTKLASALANTRTRNSKIRDLEKRLKNTTVSIRYKIAKTLVELRTVPKEEASNKKIERQNKIKLLEQYRNTLNGNATSENVNKIKLFFKSPTNSIRRIKELEAKLKNLESSKPVSTVDKNKIANLENQIKKSKEVYALTLKATQNGLNEAGRARIVELETALAAKNSEHGVALTAEIAKLKTKNNLSAVQLARIVELEKELAAKNSEHMTELAAEIAKLKAKNNLSAVQLDRITALEKELADLRNKTATNTERAKAELSSKNVLHTAVMTNLQKKLNNATANAVREKTNAEASIKLLQNTLKSGTDLRNNEILELHKELKQKKNAVATAESEKVKLLTLQNQVKNGKISINALTKRLENLTTSSQTVVSERNALQKRITQGAIDNAKKHLEFLLNDNRTVANLKKGIEKITLAPNNKTSILNNKGVQQFLKQVQNKINTTTVKENIENVLNKYTKYKWTKLHTILEGKEVANKSPDIPKPPSDLSDLNKYVAVLLEIEQIIESSSPGTTLPFGTRVQTGISGVLDGLSNTITRQSLYDSTEEIGGRRVLKEDSFIRRLLFSNKYREKIAQRLLAIPKAATTGQSGPILSSASANTYSASIATHLQSANQTKHKSIQDRMDEVIQFFTHVKPGGQPGNVIHANRLGRAMGQSTEMPTSEQKYNYHASQVRKVQPTPPATQRRPSTTKPQPPPNTIKANTVANESALANFIKTHPLLAKNKPTFLTSLRNESKKAPNKIKSVLTILDEYYKIIKAGFGSEKNFKNYIKTKANLTNKQLDMYTEWLYRNNNSRNSTPGGTPNNLKSNNNNKYSNNKFENETGSNTNSNSEVPNNLPEKSIENKIKKLITKNPSGVLDTKDRLSYINKIYGLLNNKKNDTTKKLINKVHRNYKPRVISNIKPQEVTTRQLTSNDKPRRPQSIFKQPPSQFTGSVIGVIPHA